MDYLYLLCYLSYRLYLFSLFSLIFILFLLLLCTSRKIYIIRKVFRWFITLTLKHVSVCQIQIQLFRDSVVVIVSLLSHEETPNRIKPANEYFFINIFQLTEVWLGCEAAGADSSLILIPHTHTSYLHLILTPHTHTSYSNLIFTPHTHTSYSHLAPTHSRSLHVYRSFPYALYK